MVKFLMDWQLFIDTPKNLKKKVQKRAILKFKDNHSMFLENYLKFYNTEKKCLTTSISERTKYFNFKLKIFLLLVTL